VTGGGKETFTVEGFYARPAFALPGREVVDFYIHHDPARQRGLEGKDFGYVKFDILKDDKGRTLTPDASNRNELVPKYGAFVSSLVNYCPLIVSISFRLCRSAFLKWSAPHLQI
jgi:hypothetical protein